MTNRLHRYEAIARGDKKENLMLSNVSDTRKKSKKHVAEKDILCESEFCYVTIHDVNVQLVCCDTCGKWFHSMCEGLSPIDEVGGGGDYICVNCSGRTDRSQIFTETINKLIAEEDVINRDIISKRVLCDNLKAVYTNIIGSREKALNAALESIKVIRQAYHGNVMVGNHCVIVLKNFQTLTSVISDNNELLAKFNQIFSIFSEIMMLIMCRRFLEENEISRLEDLCHQFGEVFPIHFPERKTSQEKFMSSFLTCQHLCDNTKQLDYSQNKKGKVSMHL